MRARHAFYGGSEESTRVKKTLHGFSRDREGGRRDIYGETPQHTPPLRDPSRPGERGLTFFVGGPSSAASSST